jgi:hypothetical protein
MNPVDFRPYREALRARICSYCVDKTADGRCGRDADDLCPLLAHVDLVVGAVLEVGETAYTRPYLEALVKHVCPSCRQGPGASCALRETGRCNLDAYLVPVVEVVEEVARRRKEGAWTDLRAASEPSRRRT